MNGSRFVDHSGKVRAQMDGNVQAALAAMGIKATNLIINQMQTGYGEAIRQSGDLMRDVGYEIERSAPKAVDIGNSLPYARYAHDGMPNMPARPYIRDAIFDGADELKQAAVGPLKQGF